MEAATPAESLNCPNCGAPLPDPAGRPTLVCDHCGSVIAFKPPPAAPSAPAALADSPAPAEIDPRYNYGPQPSRRPARSELTSVALGPADAAHVIQLLRAGQESEATQFYQSKVGGSLGEAKDSISAIQSGLQDASAPVGAGASVTSANPADLPQVVQYLVAGKRLEAIRAYRQATGASLRQAETAINDLQADLGGAPAAASRPVPATARTGGRSCIGGCGSLVGIVVVVVLAILGIQYSHSEYVRKTTIYRCGQAAIEAQLASQELLQAPIRGGYPVWVPRYKPAADISDWTFSAEYFAPVWDAHGWGLLDVHLADDSTGSNSVSARLYKDGQWRLVLPAAQIQCRA